MSARPATRPASLAAGTTVPAAARLAGRLAGGATTMSATTILGDVSWSGGVSLHLKTEHTSLI